MYHLLKGLHEYLTRSEPRLRLSRPSKATLSCYITHRKDEFSVIIIGLDGAGKSVRTATLPDSNILLSLLFGFTQTLLEKIKTLYNDTPGLPPDKIVPTVGQNSTHYSRFSARNLFTKRRIHIFSSYLSVQPGRYLCPQPCSNSGISEANAGSDPFGRNTTATATPSST